MYCMILPGPLNGSDPTPQSAAGDPEPLGLGRYVCLMLLANDPTSLTAGSTLGVAVLGFLCLGDQIISISWLKHFGSLLDIAWTSFRYTLQAQMRSASALCLTYWTHVGYLCLTSWPNPLFTQHISK